MEKINLEATLHFLKMSEARKEAIKKIGIGNVVNQFIVDKGHENGKEIHIVTSTGLIIIRNYHTRKYITILIARPQQIKRYYENCNKPLTGEVLKVVRLAEEHTKQGLNQL